jgi:hypothetical protein
MIYITLDTDVWLKLLHDVNQNTDEIGPFDELMFWLEQGHLKLVLPQNIKTEWERNKESTIQAAKRELKKNFQSGRELFKNHSALSSFYDPDQYENFVRGRVQRIDKLFASCEIAHTTDEVMIKAGKRSLERLAPNHTDDSFRDSVNVISLMDHLINKGYQKCFFASDNYKDFSEPNGSEAILHNQLAADFKEANLEYVYTGRALIYRKLKAQLPSYSDFLIEERRKAEQAELQEQRQSEEIKNENAGNEFLENTFYIDRILAKKNPSVFDQQILDNLIATHPSYQSYILKKIGDGGLV